MVNPMDRKIKHTGKKYAIIVSRFNEHITTALFKGCMDELTKLKVKINELTVVWVPGSFELPLTALKLAQKKNIDAVICLGAVIRGETKHFDLIAENTAAGIMQASLSTGKPVIMGVLTTDTVEQAQKRSQEKGFNLGRNAAHSAVDMVDVMSTLQL